MSTIVFACKSNSCRSQMAEGWAQKWIESEKQYLDSSIKNQKSNNVKKVNHDAILHRLSILQNTIVASVALDSGAVFMTPNNKNYYLKESECQITNNVNDGVDGQVQPQRKHIKSKAIEAMAQDGVDISSFIPKTVDELIPVIDSQRNLISECCNGGSDGINSTTSSSKQEEEKYQEELLNSTYPKDSSTSSGNIDSQEFIKINKEEGEEQEEKEEDVILDKLIVLCSCGDALKHNLIRRSKSVEEWSIDAPTAAAKAGEGDEAYRRVSLQIREEVNNLMNSLFGETALLLE